jgi:ribonuclease J
MNLMFHRGTHEIGGTCVEISTDNTRIIIDVGLPFVLENGEEINLDEVYKLSPEELTKKGIVKDIPGLFKWDQNNKPPDAILITHPHLDHFGLLPFVKPNIPLYMSEGTKLMIGKVSNLFNRIDQNLSDVRLMAAWKHFKVGDFDIKPFLADHAGFDARGFLIEADGKRVFFTGDFRGHGKKSISFEKMVENPPKDIDYLITEGTHIEGGDNPFKTEEDVESAIVDVLKKTKGPVFINYSSQNIDRIVTIYNACAKAKRTFVIDPLTAHVLDVAKEISGKIPHLRNDPCNIFRIFYAQGKHTNILAETERPRSRWRWWKRRERLLFGFPKESKIGYDQIKESRDQIVIRDTYFIRKQLRAKDLMAGASFIYSQWEGYLKGEGSEKSFWDELGIEIKQIHVSGHATLDELKRFITAFNPKHIIPFHTPAPEKFTEHFGDKVIDVTDGQQITL